MKTIVIAYDSRTGNVERFIKKLKKELEDRNSSKFEWVFHKIEEDLIIEQEFHFITYTTNFGEIPLKTIIFAGKNYEKMQSISSSGNMNWGPMYGKAANKLSSQYEVPILVKFELSGTRETVEKVIGGLERYYGD